MIRINQSESTAAAQKYFERNLQRGDYYFEGQEMAGSWGGKAAEALGLEGPIDREVFLKLLENIRPGGSPLTARTNENRRPGYDFTFDVPKSVSLVHAFSGDERIVEAMRKAVMETMEEMEEEMHARVRKNGAFTDRKTSRMLWADFTHLTTRPSPLDSKSEGEVLHQHPWMERFRDAEGKLCVPDPHLHMHLYVINATYDEVEDMWKAGEFMRLKRDARYYQAAYHARLAGELQKLGYLIEPTAKAFEIAGVKREMVLNFSRRTKEVEEVAEALGISDADAKGALGAKTRRGKNRELNMEQLRDVWQTMLGRRGERAIDAIHEAAMTREMGRSKDVPEAAREGVRFALGHELERVSEVSERRLVATALERTVGRASVPTVWHAVREQSDIHNAEIEGERRLTTTGVLKMEAAMMRYIRDGRGNVPPVIPGEHEFATPVLQIDAKETQQQREAVRLVLESQDWVVGVVGRAGTGKTTLLKEVQAGLDRYGVRLVPVAPTAAAARGVLREEGFESADTVKRLLTDEAKQAQLPGSVLWVDEAGMIGDRDMLALLKLAKEQGVARVVLAGDPSQIRSVPRGDALRFLEDNAGLKTARLEVIRRQRTPELKEAVEAISRGDIDHGFAVLDAAHAIEEAAPRASHEAMAKAYAKRACEVIRSGEKDWGRRILATSPTHKEGEEVTKAIRAALQEEFLIGDTERSVARTVNLSWTESERACAASYEPELVVQFKHAAGDFKRGERVTVRDVNARDGVVQVSRNSGDISTLPLDHPDSFSVYRLGELKVARGDRLRVTENVRMNGRRWDSGTIVRVEDFEADGSIVTDKGVLPSHVGHIDHGYVVTADSAQSRSVDTVFASITSDSMSATDLRRVYVTVSRARDMVRIFTDDKEALLSAARRDTIRRSATELLGTERSEKIIHEIAHREHLRALELERQRNREAALERTRNRGMEMEMSHG